MFPENQKLQDETLKVLCMVIENEGMFYEIAIVFNLDASEYVRKLRYNGLSRIIFNIMERFPTNFDIQKNGTVLFIKTLDVREDAWAKSHLEPLLELACRAIKAFGTNPNFDYLVEDVGRLLDIIVEQDYENNLKTTQVETAKALLADVEQS